MLDKYQKDFISKKGRKIKYMHDVKEVSKEYTKYKSLKGDIADIEAKIKSVANIAS